MYIGIIGDLHGNIELLNKKINDLLENYNIELLIQVGDFSIKKKVIKKLININLPIPLYIIDGNHDDFKYLNKSIKNGDTTMWAKHNIVFMERGSTIEINKQIFGFIGGAMSIHTKQIIKNGNMITEDDLNKTLINFNKNEPDIIISHSCPEGIGIGMRENKKYLLGIYENIQSQGYKVENPNDIGEIRLKELWESISKKPALWIFGHFHKYSTTNIGKTNFIGLTELKEENEIVVIEIKNQGIDKYLK